MEAHAPISFSGVQPTGQLHIGNYFGAIANLVRIQDEGSHRSIVFVADLHAMTVAFDPVDLRRNSEQVFTDLVACGIDPVRTILFIQSMVREHTELAYLLSCFCSHGDLSRQTQFKDKSANGDMVSAALFNYPVLQAADILLYKASVVPVGRDQEQHLELARGIAHRFNSRHGECFPEPAALATETPKVMSLMEPTRKMSKSHGPQCHIGLFEEEKSIRGKVRRAVTDSGDSADGSISPGVENLLGILAASGRKEQAEAMRSEYLAGPRRYAPLKDAVADSLVALTSNLRERRAAIDPAAVKAQIKAGAEQAAAIAKRTMIDVRYRLGMA